MTEQIRISRDQGRSRGRRNRQLDQQQQMGTEIDDTARDRLAQLDTEMDAYLTQNTVENDTAAVGLPQAHLRAQPLTNETLVRGFRQTIGE